jgi:uncharacterized protein (UPF0332 family)
VKRVDLSELSRKGLVEKFQSDPDQIRNQVEIAKGDLSSAKKMLGIEEWGWAHTAAYNAMLAAGRALMFSKGYRARGVDHHVILIEFVQAVYSSKFQPDVLMAFDKARRRRNDAVYDTPNVISPSQSQNLVRQADSFVSTALQLLNMA